MNQHEVAQMLATTNRWSRNPRRWPRDDPDLRGPMARLLATRPVYSPTWCPAACACSAGRAALAWQLRSNAEPSTSHLEVSLRINAGDRDLIDRVPLRPWVEALLSSCSMRDVRRPWISCSIAHCSVRIRTAWPRS